MVLIDFWTFSCVNCVRTIPHLKVLYDGYKSRRLRHRRRPLAGVRLREGASKRRAAVKRLGVTWPVAIDSQMATWNAYQNQYWPAEYLLDQQGRIAYTTSARVTTRRPTTPWRSCSRSTGALPASTPIPANTTTPELYAGSDRGQLADNEQYATLGAPSGTRSRATATQDAIQVTGTWTDEGQYLQANGTGHVRLNFTADTVYIVAGTPGAILPVSVKLDGKSVPAGNSGSALTKSGFMVARQDLFQLLSGISSGYHLIDLTVPSGFRIYTFTFG